MQLIKSEKFLGNNKILIGDLSSDMVLQTLGKIYIRSGNNLKLLTDITETIALADPNNIIIVNSSLELDGLEYPGDGRFIYNSGNSVLYLTYKDRYIAIIEVLNKLGNYVKKEGDTMSGTLEVATTKVPFIVHSSKLVKNLNAEYLSGEPAETFAQKSKDEGITGSWRFLSDCIAEAKWQFLNNVSIKADVISSGSLQSPIFANGFTGTGWRLDGSTNTLTIDNLVVRKVMQVYELVINKISATNGSVWVSNSSKIDSVYTTDGSDRYYISGDYLIYITNTELFNLLLNDHTADELAQDVITNGENSEYYTLLYTYNIESEINKNIELVIVLNNLVTTEGLYSTYFEGGKLYVIYTDKNEYSTLKTGDIVRCLKFLDNTIKYYDALVYNLIDVNKYVILISKNVWDKYSKIEYDDNGNLVKVTTKENDNLYKKTRFDYLLDSSDTDYFVSKLALPALGDDLVQIGNIQDPTRQGAIYLTATDDLGPYIEVLDGINRPDYSTLKELPIFVTYLYKNILYYVSTTQKINNIEGVSLGNFTIANDNTITKSDPETNSGTSLYGYKYPYDTSFLIKKEVSKTDSRYLSKYSNPVKVRLGNLEGIYNYLLGNKQPHGYGLYGENVYLTGEFYLNNGKSVVDFSEELIMLKYGKAGMTIKDGKISFEAGILDINMDSAGNESRVRFNDGTMIFYHKITLGEYDKIKNESEESGTDISNIIQDDKGIWVRSIYLGYGIPNSDDSGENPILSPEPLLIFCDNKGLDLYNLGPSGMFKAQIQSPAVHKNTIAGFKLLSGKSYDPLLSDTLYGDFSDINYFYLTLGNNEVQKKFGVMLYSTVDNSKVISKPIYIIARDNILLETFDGTSADEDPPTITFSPNLSANILAPFVNYQNIEWQAKEWWFTPFIVSNTVNGSEWGINIPYQIITNNMEGTYSRDKKYSLFWNLIDGTGVTIEGDSKSIEYSTINSSILFLRTLFTLPSGLIKDLPYSGNTAFISNGNDNITFSPIYAAVKNAGSLSVTNIAYELAYSIYSILISNIINSGSYTIGQFSNSTLVYQSDTGNYSIVSTQIASSCVPTKEESTVTIYNVKYPINAKKYLFDNAATKEGTIITAPANGSNIIEVIMTIGEDNSITFSTSSTSNKYIFYK